MSIIAMMTDFGHRDHYVAVMKGVILQINPKVTIVDVSHDIASHDVFHGAFVLRQSLPCFPSGTIFLAVIDPTVGTRRRLLAARYCDRIVLAPDNGLLTLLHRDAELQELRIIENRRFFASKLSGTFHGRDILAPVAGHLSRGVKLEALGPPADHIEALSLPTPVVRRDGTITGEVVLIDRFGNLITNISEFDLAALRTQRVLQVTVGPHDVGPIRTTYAEVPAGRPLALIGSTQMLEIAVNCGDAARTLNVSRGTPLIIR